MTKFLPWWPKITANLATIFLGVFLLVAGILLYANLGRDALFDWDEGIYAELGRQVVVSGDILTPSWNGEVWLEKPPGVAWASGLGIALLGPSAEGARLLMPLLALYVLYIVYRLGTKLGSWQHGLVAAGVLLGFNLFLGRTRAVNTDMALLASIVTTVLFLLEKRPPWSLALAIFGGVWFKGLAGLLSLLIGLPLLLSMPKRYIINSILYLLILILPWHLFVYLKHGDLFLTPYFFEQVVRRATAQIEFHFETRWYYFDYLYTNLGLGVLLVSAIGVLRTLLTRKHLYLVWWTLLPLCLFTLAKTRLFWYILPIYPALSLLIALAIGSFARSQLGKSVLTILTVGILLQSLLTASNSVELGKTQSALPDRLQVARDLSQISSSTLHILVPPSERLSEALLPDIAKLSSSFRYGGMPSVVYYYQGHVQFYYNVDAFLAFWDQSDNPLALVAVDDLPLLDVHFVPVSSTPTYLGISKGLYAQR